MSGGVLSSNRRGLAKVPCSGDKPLGGAAYLSLRALGSGKSGSVYHSMGLLRLCDAEGRRTADVCSSPASRHPAQEGEGEGRPCYGNHR